MSALDCRPGLSCLLAYPVDHFIFAIDGISTEVGQANNGHYMRTDCSMCGPDRPIAVSGGGGVFCRRAHFVSYVCVSRYIGISDGENYFGLNDIQNEFMYRPAEVRIARMASKLARLPPDKRPFRIFP